MRQIVAILNPRADRGRTARLAEQLRLALASVCDVDLAHTTGRGNATKLAQQAAEHGAKAVVAIGGDGTVHEVANGLMQAAPQQRPALGIVPVGSGNDLAFALGMSCKLDDAVERIRRPNPRPIDVGEIRAGDDIARYWVCNVGMLLDGEINRLSQRLNWPRGSGLYLRAALQQLLRPPRVAELVLEVDGSTIVEQAVMLSVGNGPRSGGRFLLTPEAKIDDGRGDYVLVRPMPRWKLLHLMYKSLGGERLAALAVAYGQFGKLKVRCNIPIVAHIDGEPAIGDGEDVYEVTVRMLPAALNVLA